MSSPAAGTTRKRLFSRNDYLAPLPIPTGEKPADVLNTIWRKNEVFLDIGSYSIGSGVMVIWPVVVLFLFLAYVLQDVDALWLGACITGIPLFILIQSLFRPVPLPVRFNRQRREVCVPREDGEYWIVPWESVTAAATQHSTVSQAGKASLGLLVVGFDNPDPQAREGQQHFSLGFSCGGGDTAMALWECMRSYMEIGPQAVPKCNFAGENSGRSLLGWFLYLLAEIFRALFRGDILAVLKESAFMVLFGSPLGFYLQEKKLVPPPDLPYPDIIEWSKPLPSEQWAQRSPELEVAIAQREAELAAGKA